MADSTTKTTFIVVTTDGRHSTISRDAYDQGEIPRIERSLRQHGLGGYLCCMEGTYHAATATVRVVGLRTFNRAQAPNTDPNAIDPYSPWVAAMTGFARIRAGLYPKAATLRDWQGEG